MKKNNKSVFFIVSILILAFAASTLFGFSTYFGDIETVRIKGVKDIRLGIDIQGGVDVTFKPEGDTDVSESQLKVATEVMKARLVSLNINDSEVYNDTKNDRIIVRFPWQAGEKNFDPEAAVKELGDTAELTFRIGDEYDTDEEGNITPKGEIVLRGADINTASNGPATEEEGGGYLVQLKLNDSGKEKFAKATAQLAGSSTPLSIWLDDEMISAPTVKEALTQGTAVITGNFTYESSKLLADKINSGALPFNLETVSFKTISPTMGQGSLDAMILAGIIAMIFIAIYMIVLYRLPGFVAVIGLIGQVAGSLAAVSGWFGFMNSSTLTIPGIAGIILAVGMGVDANIITAERIKEEINTGKTVESSLRVAYKRAFTAILDGNLTMILVAIVLMGAFGVPSSPFAKLLKPLFFAFGATTEGVIYSFGFTLMVGIILNFLMGVFCSRLMLTSLAKFKVFKNKKLYGGATK
ncbi:MAG: SecD/SecF family protein translocase subunit [Ruminococcus sp.]|nr:SecD/SecF family protein translocase subunit [Ruminococcus sp.]MBQ7008495.1 SecD/SecF family protein translocase subunit [Ruminococcus sp.]MBR4023594.1 SecD/SecF family protein translocase subunit [Ruminococcus sp.]